MWVATQHRLTSGCRVGRPYTGQLGRAACNMILGLFMRHGHCTRSCRNGCAVCNYGSYGLPPVCQSMWSAQPGQQAMSSWNHPSGGLKLRCGKAVSDAPLTTRISGCCSRGCRVAVDTGCAQCRVGRAASRPCASSTLITQGATKAWQTLLTIWPDSSSSGVWTHTCPGLDPTIFSLWTAAIKHCRGGDDEGAVLHTITTCDVAGAPVRPHPHTAPFACTHAWATPGALAYVS
jgi:hypothetical protein